MPMLSAIRHVAGRGTASLRHSRQPSPTRFLGARRPGGSSRSLISRRRVRLSFRHGAQAAIRSIGASEATPARRSFAYDRDLPRRVSVSGARRDDADGMINGAGDLFSHIRPGSQNALRNASVSFAFRRQRVSIILIAARMETKAIERRPSRGCFARPVDWLLAGMFWLAWEAFATQRKSNRRQVRAILRALEIAGTLFPYARREVGSGLVRSGISYPAGPRRYSAHPGPCREISLRSQPPLSRSQFLLRAGAAQPSIPGPPNAIVCCVAGHNRRNLNKSICWKRPTCTSRGRSTVRIAVHRSRRIIED